MAAFDNFYSQFIGWSKILLPLCALALLSTLFLFARAPGDQSEVPFAEIAELAREQSIGAPRFSGVTSNGSTISVTAVSARPDAEKPDTIAIQELLLSLDAADGSAVRITAGAGSIDGRNQTLRMNQLARLTTSTGYVMETTGLRANFETGLIASDGALEVRTPFGALTAGQVTIQMTKDSTNQEMLFTQGVRLVYQPNNPETQP